MPGMTVSESAVAPNVSMELRQRLERERLIRRIIELGSPSTDLNALLEAAAGEIGRFFGVEHA